MAKVQYRLSSRAANGRAEVLVRFYDGESFSQRAKTHVLVSVEAWDSSTGTLIVPRRTTPEAVEILEKQNQLDRLAKSVYEAWWRDRYDMYNGWLQQVVDSFFDAPRPAAAQARMLLKDVVMECALSKDLAERSVAQYRVLAEALSRYEKKTHPLYADCFTEQDIDGFVRFFSNEEVSVKGRKKHIQRSNNTIAAKLKKLAAVCNYAVGKGYMAESPFRNGRYRIQGEVYGDPVYLNLEERNRLYAFQGLSPAQVVQRDIFVFQCHIGCRVSDLVELTADNITVDGFVQYIQHKLRKSKPVVVRVPLSDTALEIIERYRDSERKQLLPFVHPNKYNEAIHEILRIAGINRIVMIQNPKTLAAEPHPLWEVASSHIARRTFMANMFKATKSERITSAFTGHVNGSRAFSRYTSVDDDMKLEVLRAMHERK